MGRKEANDCLDSEGKIKYLGLSEISANTLRRACKVHHIDAVELEYSPFCLDIESPQWPILKAARELGVAVVAYSPLGRYVPFPSTPYSTSCSLPSSLIFWTELGSNIL